MTITSVTITPDADNSGFVCENQTYTAILVGGTAPITYVWSSTGLQSGQGTATAVYQWSITCGQTISVTVTDADNSQSDTLDIELTLHLSQIADAIQDTLEANMSAVLLARVYGWDELPEGVNDAPSLMCYWQSGRADAVTETDRFSFAGVRNKELIFNVDYYASTRNHLGQDNARLTNAMSEIIDFLETASSGACVDGTGQCPPFGLCALKTFQWSCERVIFDYGGVEYYGARCAITFRAF